MKMRLLVGHWSCGQSLTFKHSHSKHVKLNHPAADVSCSFSHLPHKLSVSCGVTAVISHGTRVCVRVCVMRSHMRGFFVFVFLKKRFYGFCF